MAGDLFNSNFATTSPYGFTTAFIADAGVTFTHVASATGGPANRPWLRETHLVHSQQQYYHGYKQTGLSSPSLGTSRFWRFRMRVNSDIAMLGAGSEALWFTKQSIWGDGGVDTQRVISFLTDHLTDTNPQFEVDENIGSGTTPQTVPKGVWFSVACEARMSSTNGATDGYYKVWINNDTYASPSASFTGVAVYPAAFTSYSHGWYAQTTLRSGGKVIIDYAQIEIATTFDATFHATLTDEAAGDSPSISPSASRSPSASASRSISPSPSPTPSPTPSASASVSPSASPSVSPSSSVSPSPSPSPSLGLRQIFCARSEVQASSNPSNSAVRYVSPLQYVDFNATETNSTVPWLVSGVFRNLTIEHRGIAPGVGTDFTYTLLVNGTPTALSAVISGTNTSGSDVSNEATVTAGDTVVLRCTPTGTPAQPGASNIYSTLEFESDDDNTSGYALDPFDAPSVSATEYNGLLWSRDWLPTTPLTNATCVAAAGTFTEIAYRLPGTPGAGKNYTYTIYKNGVAQNGGGGTPNTVVTIADSATTGSATFSMSAVGGDVFYIECVPTGTPTSRAVTYATKFVATTAGQSHFTGTSTAAEAGTSYAMVSTVHNVDVASGGENGAAVNSGPTSFTLHHFYVDLTTAPGGGTSHTLTLRRSETTPGSPVTATISGAATTGSDTSNSTSFTSGDRISLEITHSGSPAANTGWRWAFIQELAAASPSPSPTPSVTPSPSVSPSASPSPTTSPSLSPSASASPSASVSLSPSPSASASHSASPSASPSITPSPSISPSASPTPSPSVSPTLSPSASFSPSASASPSSSTSPSVPHSLGMLELDPGQFLYYRGFGHS